MGVGHREGGREQNQNACAKLEQEIVKRGDNLKGKSLPIMLTC